MICKLISVLFAFFWNRIRNRIVRHKPTKTPLTQGETGFTGVVLGKIVRSPLAPPPDPNAPTDLLLTTEEKRRHAYLLGSTGSGKTNTLLNMVRADIEQGRGVCLLDARGELVDRVLMILAAGILQKN